jgi:hypothetical protein
MEVHPFLHSTEKPFHLLVHCLTVCRIPTSFLASSSLLPWQLTSGEMTVPIERMQPIMRSGQIATASWTASRVGLLCTSPPSR